MKLDKAGGVPGLGPGKAHKNIFFKGECGLEDGSKGAGWVKK
jgi:hypothetical protein